MLSSRISRALIVPNSGLHAPTFMTSQTPEIHALYTGNWIRGSLSRASHCMIDFLHSRSNGSENLSRPWYSRLMETSTPLSMNRAAHLRSTPLVINQPNHQDVQPALKIPPSSPIRHQECCAYVALGSNIGNRIKNIENACRELTKRGLKVLRTSALYETKAMYFEDQPPFLNGVCEVSS
jgi:hypothetical protein